MVLIIWIFSGLNYSSLLISAFPTNARMHTRKYACAQTQSLFLSLPLLPLSLCFTHSQSPPHCLYVSQSVCLCRLVFAPLNVKLGRIWATNCPCFCCMYHKLIAHTCTNITSHCICLLKLDFSHRWYDTAVNDVYNYYNRNMNDSSMFISSTFSKVVGCYICLSGSLFTLTQSRMVWASAKYLVLFT